MTATLRLRLAGALVALALARCTSSGAGDEPAPTSVSPNRALTPGETFAGVTADDVCVPGYARRVRNVPLDEMRAVDARYRFHYVRGESEMDHLIPLELGGDNALANLWPQPRGGTWNAQRKDELENVLHERVCSERLSLDEAQRLIATDWVDAYQRYVAGNADDGTSWDSAGGRL